MEDNPTAPVGRDGTGRSPEGIAEAIVAAVLDGGRSNPGFGRAVRVASGIVSGAMRASVAEPVTGETGAERVARLEWFLAEALREVERQRVQIDRLMAGLDGQDRFIAELSEAIAEEGAAEGVPAAKEVGPVGRH